jgi:hypothetical protein
MKYSRASIFLILFLLLVSCGPTPEATVLPESAATPEQATSLAPTDTPVPTATLAPTVTPVPTATPESVQPAAPTPTTETSQADLPTSTPMEAPTPTPTTVPPTATPTTAATPTPGLTPAPQAGGVAGFRDNLAVADQFILNLTDVSMPAEGQVYQGWLVGDDGATTSVGVLNLSPDGSVSLEWNSPASENLLSRYVRFQVTLEPSGGSPSPTGQVVLVGGLEGQKLTNARRLFVRNGGEPATPLDTAFALGLRSQTDVAVQHVQNAANAAAIGALPEMRFHLEHVVNILEGAAGPRFGDHDGNGVAENPGDGFGVIGYSSQIAQLFSDQPPVTSAASDVQAQSAVIEDKCLEILTIQDMAAAAAQLGELKALADQLKAGPMTSLYQAAQGAISFSVSPVR